MEQMEATISHTPAATGILAAPALLACRASAQSEIDIFDSFETFSGASGSSVVGFVGEDKQSESWNTGGNAIVMVGDGTAYHGDNDLRLLQQVGQHERREHLRHPPVCKLLVRPIIPHVRHRVSLA